MMSTTKFGGTFHFLARGDFGGLVLVTLQEKPMHGYEIMKALEERFHGFYKPSAGAIYPALQSLLRKGYVTVSGGERRKTYKITPKGQSFLRSRKAAVKGHFKEMVNTLGPERAGLLQELRSTGRLLGTNMKTMTPEQAKELRSVMVRMRKEIVRILAE